MLEIPNNVLTTQNSSSRVNSENPSKLNKFFKEQGFLIKEETKILNNAVDLVMRYTSSKYKKVITEKEDVIELIQEVVENEIVGNEFREMDKQIIEKMNRLSEETAVTKYSECASYTKEILSYATLAFFYASIITLGVGILQFGFHSNVDQLESLGRAIAQKDVVLFDEAMDELMANSIAKKQAFQNTKILFLITIALFACTALVRFLSYPINRFASFKNQVFIQYVTMKSIIKPSENLDEA